jgi:hypothetical protein
MGLHHAIAYMEVGQSKSQLTQYHWNVFSQEMYILNNKAVPKIFFLKVGLVSLLRLSVNKICCQWKNKQNKMKSLHLMV